MPSIRDFLYKPPRRHFIEVTALDGETVLPFDLRLLSADDTSAIEDKARDAAKAAGIADPKPEDGPYLRTRMTETVLSAATDKDSPLNKPEPFFRTAAEVRQWFDDARIAFVYQEQRAFQQKFAPQPESTDYEEYVRLVHASVKEAQSGGDPERPFVGLPYRKLTSFAAISVGVLTSPTLPQLLFGSLIPPGPDATSVSLSSSPGAEPTTSSMSEPLTPPSPPSPLVPESLPPQGSREGE